jgi:DNA-binding NarL/FixJ family response regulator
LERSTASSFFKPARENGFGGRVLVVAAVLSFFAVRWLTQAGAAGVFLKQNPPKLLVDAIRAVMGGQLYIDPALQNYLPPGRAQEFSGNSDEARTGCG